MQQVLRNDVLQRLYAYSQQRTLPLCHLQVNSDSVMRTAGQDSGHEHADA